MSPWTCSICGSRNGTLLLRITKPDRFELAVGIREDGYERSWIECRECRVATNCHDPTHLPLLEKIAEAYYRIDFAGSSIRQKFDKVMGLPAGKSDNALRVSRILDFLHTWMTACRGNEAAGSEPLRALDIGAGTGVFLARLLQDGAIRDGAHGGITATAVEPDPEAASHLESLGGFTVVPKAFPCEQAKGPFDLVTLNKILEHIPQPIPFLSRIDDVLSDAGIIYVEVPDITTASFRPPSDNILGALHRHLYSPAGLLHVIEKAGFLPIEVSRYLEPSGKLSVACFATRRETWHSHIAQEQKP